MYKLFGREPALWSGLFASTVMLVRACAFPLTVDQYGLLRTSSPGWYFNAYLKGRY